MSVSYSPTPAVSFPARRTQIRPAQDTPLATVRDIASAPSVRRRIEAQRADDPAFLRPPAPPRRREKPSRRGMVTGAFATLALSVGLALQPDTYDGPTVMKAAVSGDSVWSMAQNVRSERPLEEIVADIERLNDISGAIHPGQRVVVPVR